MRFKRKNGKRPEYYVRYKKYRNTTLFWNIIERGNTRYKDSNICICGACFIYRKFSRDKKTILINTRMGNSGILLKKQN